MEVRRNFYLCVCPGVCVGVCVRVEASRCPVLVGCIILALITDLFCAVSQLSIFENCISFFTAFVSWFVFIFIFFDGDFLKRCEQLFYDSRHPPE